MLRTTVGWTLMFRVRNPDKAKKELRRAEEVLGTPLCLGTCERYWKIPELWTCDAEMQFEAPSIAEQITRCLLLANRLAIGWYVLCPYLQPDGTLQSFAGIFDGRHPGAKLASLEWAQFQVLPSTASGSS
jgi:hypothetical protein